VPKIFKSLFLTKIKTKNRFLENNDFSFSIHLQRKYQQAKDYKPKRLML